MPKFNEFRISLSVRRKDGEIEFRKGLMEAGISHNMAEDEKPRVMPVDILTGQAMKLRDRSWPQYMVRLEGAIQHYTIIRSAADSVFMLIIVGTTKGSYFLFIGPSTVKAYEVGGDGTSPRRSILALYERQLNGGRHWFDLIPSLYPNLFSHLFSMFGDCRMLYRMTAAYTSSRPMRCKIYIYHDDPSLNAISLDGYVYHLDLDTYPIDALRQAHWRLEADDFRAGRVPELPPTPIAKKKPKVIYKERPQERLTRSVGGYTMSPVEKERMLNRGNEQE